VPVGREEKGEILQCLSPNACFDTGLQLANSVNDIKFCHLQTIFLEQLVICTSSPPRSKTRQNDWEGRGGWTGASLLQQASLDTLGLMLGCLSGTSPASSGDGHSEVEVADFSGLSAKLVLIS